MPDLPRYFADLHPRSGWRVIDRLDGMALPSNDQEEAETDAARLNDPNYDGAPSETDTVGYASNDRAALRDAGRRHPNV